MDPKDPNRDAKAEDSLQPNPSADEFFNKMNRDFRRPKPSEEAVAAALQAIQALTSDASVEERAESTPDSNITGAEAERKCPKCGGENSESNRFCGFCGGPLEQSSPAKVSAKTRPEQHVHHHHYHHHYFPSAGVNLQPGEASEAPASSVSDDEDSKSTDSILRTLVEAWARAFNAKRADELCKLYSSDALLVRSGAPLVRGRALIKQVLQSELEGGLGDVQLDCSEIGVIGELACIAGVSRMLSPIAPANRQERAGKFLMLLRYEGAEWKILADVWCLDAVSPSLPGPKARK